MKNALIILLVGIFAISAYSLITIQPIHANAATDALRTGADQIGTAGFGETATGDQLPARIGAIIKIILGLLGIVVVLIVVYAGFLWMTAGGDPDQTKKARGWIIDAVIGLAIILSAYAITDFVIGKLVQIT